MSYAVELNKATVLLGGKPVLLNIQLCLKDGEHTCILGPNGSGKSTLVRLISGDVFPLYRNPPAVRIFGQERWDLFSLRNRLGIVSDSLQIWQSRGHENVRDTILSGYFGGIGVPLHTEPESWMIEKTKNTARLLEIDELLDKKVNHISSGQMRRVLVARALVHDPGMLLLDEPYVSLDIAARHIFGEQVRTLARIGLTIILITHELSEIPPEIDRVILIKEGQVLADGSKQNILTSEIISELFNLPLKVFQENGTYWAEPL